MGLMHPTYWNSLRDRAPRLFHAVVYLAGDGFDVFHGVEQITGASRWLVYGAELVAGHGFNTLHGVEYLAGASS